MENTTLRLQKYFTDCGVLSRRAAEEEIRCGRVTVNGAIATVGQQIDPAVDVVVWRGKRIRPTATEHHYILLNKPRGFVTTLSDEKGRKTVAELVADVGARLYPVGRLDMDSDGLLLMTDDGELTNRLTHPRHEIPKLYHVTVKGTVDQDTLARLRAPFLLDGYRTLPVQVEILACGGNGTRLCFSLYEGRNRQIRRMCEALGYNVVKLKRVRINSIKLGSLQPGQWKELTDKEVKELMAQYQAEGLNEEEAKAKAEANSPLMLEAREMLRKWEANDPEVRGLWEKMNNWVYAGFDETYAQMGVGFDKIYYESQTYLEGKEKVMEGLEKGFFFRKEDNSVWADLTAEGLDHKLLLRGDGTSVYMTQDIGTAKLRFQDYPIDKMIYVVGNEQNYHFQVLSILLDKLGFEWGKGLVHFSYGMVELPEGKMKSREGTVVDADDLMAAMIETAKETSAELGKLDGLTQEEADNIARIVGLGALKYFILKVDARKNMTFNPKESIDFNGNTGPFIQYTYARIQSVLRKAAEQGIAIPEVIPAGLQLSTKEEGLIQMLADFKNTVKQAGTDYNPSVIANYAYDLVKEYNQFYHDFSILREENEALKIFRLALSQNVGKIVKLAMGLLGIEVPERM